MKDISVIGCGRWGTFLAWYAANRCQDKIQNVLMYDLKTSPNFIELRDTRKNEYLALSDNMYLFDALDKVLVNDTVIISIGCQHLRSLARELNGYDLNGKTFLLAMKGLEEPSAKIMHDVFREEVKQNVHVAVLSGPGHVQDYMKNVPSAAVIDSLEEGTKDYLIKLLQSDLIRFLDGLEWYGLKGALMARAPVEVGRLIRHFGGNPMSAYGLAHLGDYEATLFSKYSHNRSYGEAFAKGERFAKLAEGVPTLKAVKIIADKEGIDMPICQALYKAIYENADIEQTIRSMFERDLKREF